MNNAPNPNAGSGPPPQGQPANQPPNNQPQHHPKFTKGEITFHILIVVLLMVSSGIAYKAYTIVGAIAMSISVVIIAFVSNKLNATIHNSIAEWASRKIDNFYAMLAHTSRRTRLATLFILVRICLLSLVITKLIFLFAFHPLVLSHCNTTLNQVVKLGSETVGLSTSCIVFDIQRPDGTLKIQAAVSFAQGNTQNGLNILNTAHQQDSSDGEAVIHYENQKVQTTHIRTITLVVATILTGPYGYMGRDELQGVAIAQQDFNAGNQAMKLVVVIANMGSNQDTASATTKLIVNAVKNDDFSPIGIIGPPQCAQTKMIMDTMSAQKTELPVISPSASCDELTKSSPYLFQIAPANSILTQVAASYIQKISHTQPIAIFTNEADTEDSGNQTNDLKKNLSLPPIVEPFVPGDVQKINAGIGDMQSRPIPGAIFCSCSSSDLSTLLENLPTTGPFAHIPVIGLDPLYSLGGYDQNNRQLRVNFKRLKLVTLFFPDETAFLKVAKPAFLGEYSKLFDPHNTHSAGIYGFSRMGSAVALAYDATNVLLNALPPEGTAMTTENVIAELTNTADGGAWQGVTGQIDFSHGNVPYEKAIVILTVDQNDKFHMVMLANGCYQKDQCTQTPQATLDVTVDESSPLHENECIFHRYGKNGMLVIRKCI